MNYERNGNGAVEEDGRYQMERQGTNAELLRRIGERRQMIKEVNKKKRHWLGHTMEESVC